MQSQLASSPTPLLSYKLLTIPNTCLGKSNNGWCGTVLTYLVGSCRDALDCRVSGANWRGITRQFGGVVGVYFGSWDSVDSALRFQKIMNLYARYARHYLNGNMIGTAYQ